MDTEFFTILLTPAEESGTFPTAILYRMNTITVDTSDATVMELTNAQSSINKLQLSFLHTRVT